MQTPSPANSGQSPAAAAPAVDSQASDELVLSKESNGVFWPVLRTQAEPGQRFMLQCSGKTIARATVPSTYLSHHERLIALFPPAKTHVQASDALQPGAVELPSGGAVGGDGSFAVELYELGRGVSIERERSDLSGAEAAFELDTGFGNFLLFNPRLANTAKRSIETIQRDIGSVITKFQAEDEINQSIWMGDFQNVLDVFGHGAAPKAAIVSLKGGTGKTTLAVEIAQHLGCTRVWDEWVPDSHPILPGTLHLTNATVSIEEVAA